MTEMINKAGGRSHNNKQSDRNFKGRKPEGHISKSRHELGGELPYRELSSEEVEDISARILYEDNHLLIFNKRAGEIVQGDKTGDEPLSDMLKAFIAQRDGKPGHVFMGVPHRLDRPVSGIAVFAKTSKALERLNDMFRDGAGYAAAENSATADVVAIEEAAAKGNAVEEDTSSKVAPAEGTPCRRIVKTYWALVEKCPEPDQGELHHYLLRNEKQNKSYASASPRDGAKEAILKYKLIAPTKSYFLVEVELLTGRHHQIRCQLAAIGCPIKGDLKYGARRSNKDGGISLHARSISMLHPVRKERITIVAPTALSDLLPQ